MQRNDYIAIGVTILLLVAAAIGIALNVSNITWKLSAIFGAVVLGAILYNAFSASNQFKKIATGFSQEQNQQLITNSIHQLKLRVFQERDYPNFLICIIPIKGGNQEEIFLIAKNNYILINSKKEGLFGGGESTEIDFVDRIGGLLFMNAAKIRKQLGLPY